MSKYQKTVNKRNREIRYLAELLSQIYGVIKDEDELPSTREVMDRLEFVRQEQNAVVRQGKYRVEVKV